MQSLYIKIDELALSNYISESTSDIKLREAANHIKLYDGDPYRLQEPKTCTYLDKRPELCTGIVGGGG